MAKRDVDQENVRISQIPPPNSGMEHVDDVFIVITQAYCPAGHNLIDTGHDDFDGYPGVRVHVTADDREGEVLLSPFHGDNSKKGMTDWKNGTTLKLSCPECGQEFPRLATCRCSEGGALVKLFLSPNLTDSHMLAMCNVWGCRRSRTVNNWQIISEYLDGQIEE